MSDNLPWETWTPDDLAPPPQSLCQWSSRKKPLLKRPNPALSSNWRNCKCRPTSRVIRQGLPKVASKVMNRAIRKDWPGLEQGLAEAKAQQAPIHARMQQLVSEFQTTLDALDSVIASRLMQMALEAARQVIGQTPTVDNSALIKQIQQLLQQEPLFSGKPQLRVHPDDLQRVDDMLSATLSLHGWRLRGDPTLHPGGCKVSADEGDLDASVATRWQELCRLAAPGVV